VTRPAGWPGSLPWTVDLLPIKLAGELGNGTCLLPTNARWWAGQRHLPAHTCKPAPPTG